MQILPWRPEGGLAGGPLAARSAALAASWRPGQLLAALAALAASLAALAASGGPLVAALAALAASSRP